MPHRLAFAVAVLFATAAQAAPSCRDSKGAFTPCTPHQIRQSPARAHARTDKPDPAVAPATVTATKVRHVGKPLMARSRLCRDSKGLFTPCIR